MTETPKGKNESPWLEYLRKKTFGPGDVAGRKVAIFSPPGYGKTVLATRLGKRNLIITDEDGYVSLYNHPELNGTWQAIEFENWARILKILPFIESGEFTAPDGEPYDNLIFDTMSGMVGLEIQKIVADQVTPAKGRLTNETASQPDYMVSEKRLLPVMAEIAKMKRCSVTMLFHLRTGDKLTPGDTTRLDVHAAAFRVINKYTSVIAYLTIDKNRKRWLQVMPKGDGISVKTRYHFPNDIVSDDDFVAHIEKWKETN